MRHVIKARTGPVRASRKADRVWIVDWAPDATLPVPASLMTLPGAPAWRATGPMRNQGL